MNIRLQVVRNGEWETIAQLDPGHAEHYIASLQSAAFTMRMIDEIEDATRADVELQARALEAYDNDPNDTEVLLAFQAKLARSLKRVEQLNAFEAAVKGPFRQLPAWKPGDLS